MSVFFGIITIACFWVANRYPQLDGSPNEAMTIWGWFFLILAIGGLIIDTVQYFNKE